MAWRRSLRELVESVGRCTAADSELVLPRMPVSARNSSSDAGSDSSLQEAAAQIPPGLGSSGVVGRRFYKKAHMKPAEDGSGYSVMLDQRLLRTPARKPLTVPTPALALAIAAEWEWQDSTGIRPYTMPMMKLAATAIDQVPKDRRSVIASLLKYFHTDAVCCRVLEPARLAERQAKVWDPLLDWAATAIGERPAVSTSILVDSQLDPVVEAMRKELEKTDNWQLAAVDYLAGVARSLLIAMALSRNRLTVEQAIEAMRLEEDFQVQEWGLVEGGHDIDIADTRAKVYAGSVFLRLLEEK